MLDGSDPWKQLIDAEKVVKLLPLFICWDENKLLGNVPVNWLFAMSISCRFNCTERLKTPSIFPVSILFDTKKYCNEDIFLRKWGIRPDIRLLVTLNNSNFWERGLNSMVGIVPLRRLFDIIKYLRKGMVNKPAGMLSFRKLSWKFKYSNRSNEIILESIHPIININKIHLN